MLISSKSTLIEILRIIFCQLSGHSGPGRLLYKMKPCRITRGRAAGNVNYQMILATAWTQAWRDKCGFRDTDNETTAVIQMSKVENETRHQAWGMGKRSSLQGGCELKMEEKLGSQATERIGFPSAYRESCWQSRISHKLGDSRHQKHRRGWGGDCFIILELKDS